MNTLTSLTLPDITLAFGVVIAACAVILIAAYGPLQRRWLNELRESGRLDILTIIDTVGGIEMRMQRVERSLQRTALQLDRLTLRAAGPGNDYDQAIASVRAGAGCDQLVTRYGLTPVEAELLQRLHAPNGVPPLNS